MPDDSVGPWAVRRRRTIAEVHEDRGDTGPARSLDVHGTVPNHHRARTFATRERDGTQEMARIGLRHIERVSRLSDMVLAAIVEA